MAFDVVKEVVEYARSKEKEYDKKFRFTITTNGLLLDEDKRKYINENMDNCVLSLDGRREVNDEFRKTVAGTGSYDTIVPKFKRWWTSATEPRLLRARHVSLRTTSILPRTSEHCRCRF